MNNLLVQLKTVVIASERTTGVQLKSVTLWLETRLRKLTQKTLIFPVLIRFGIFYRELGGKIGPERYFRHYIVIYVATT